MPLFSTQINKEIFMKTLICISQFKQIMDGVKHAVSTDAERPVLNYIKLDIKADSVVAYGCDGYTLARVSIDNVYKGENKDEFSVLIKPISLSKCAMDGSKPIKITKSDDGTEATVAIPTADGKTELTFVQPTDSYVDISKILATAAQHDRELGVFAGQFAAAMKAIVKVTGSKRGTAIIETKQDNTQAFLMRAKSDYCDILQMFLPARIQ